MVKNKLGMMAFVRAMIEEINRRRQSPIHERRIHERYEMLQETEISILFSTEPAQQVGEMISSYVHNISRTGMGLLCHKQLAKGDVIGVRLQLSDKSRCVWATVIRTESHSTYVSSKMLRMNDIGAKFNMDYMKYFTEGLRSSDRKHRYRIQNILTESEDPIAESIFAELVDTAGDEVRCEAVFGLSKTGTEASIDPLLKLLGLNELLEIKPVNPLHEILAEADLLRDQPQMPTMAMDDDRIVIEKNGQSYEVLVQQQPQGKYTAVCPDVPNTHVTAQTRGVALKRVRELLTNIYREQPPRTLTTVLHHVFIADLAAYALRNITGLDLPFDATATPEVRKNQQDDLVKETMAWQQALPKADSES